MSNDASYQTFHIHWTILMVTLKLLWKNYNDTAFIHAVDASNSGLKWTDIYMHITTFYVQSLNMCRLHSCSDSMIKAQNLGNAELIVTSFQSVDFHACYKEYSNWSINCQCWPPIPAFSNSSVNQNSIPASNSQIASKFQGTILFSLRRRLF